MMLPIKLARFYTRSLQDSLAHWRSLKNRQDRKGMRKILSNRAFEDKEVWPRIGAEGRLMKEKGYHATLVSTMALLKYGGVVNCQILLQLG